MGAFLDWSVDTTDQIIEWLISIFVGMLGMIVAGAIVKAFTGDILEKIKIPISLWGFTFRVSVFTIVTLIVKIFVLKM